MDGDLTDAESWEHSWRRAAGRKPATWLSRLRMRDRHRAGLQAIFTYAARLDREPLDVLELGCAPGKMISSMAQLAPRHRYSGVDFAPEALGATGERLRRAGLDPALHLADIRTFTPERSYDVVVSFGLIEHFDHPDEIVAHHVRLVRRGGVVAITVPNYRNAALQRALKIYSPETLRTHNLDVMSEHALRELLERAGLQAVETGAYGGPLLPVARSRKSLERAVRVAAAAWNLATPALPRALHPWQGFLRAAGQRA